MSRSSIRVIFQCDGGGPEETSDEEEDSVNDNEEEEEEDGSEETSEDESEGEEEEATRSVPPRSTRQSNPNLKPSVGKGGAGSSKGRVTRQQTREQLPQKRLLRSRKKSPGPGSNVTTPQEIVCKKCKRKFGTKQALGLHTHWCQKQEEKKKTKKQDEDASPSMSLSLEPGVKRGRGRPRKSNPQQENSLEPVATTSQKRSRNYDEMEHSFHGEAQSHSHLQHLQHHHQEMDFMQGRSPESSPGLVDTSSESEYEQREFAANVHQLIQNRHSVSIDVVNPDPVHDEEDEEPENQEMEMQMSLPQEGPVTCSKCKMTYRTVQGFQNHWGSCMAYSSDSEGDEDDEEEVDVVHADPNPRRPEWEPVPAPPIPITIHPPQDEESSASTSSEEVNETQQQSSFHGAVESICPPSEIEVQESEPEVAPPVETQVTREEPAQKVEIPQVPNNLYIQPIQVAHPVPTSSENNLKPEMKTIPHIPPTPVVITPQVPNVIPTFAQHQHPHVPLVRLPVQNQNGTPPQPHPQLQLPPAAVQIQNHIYSRPPVPLIGSASTTTAPPIIQPSNNTPTYTQAQLMPGTVLHSSMTQVQPNHQMATGSGSGGTSESQPQPSYNPIISQPQPQPIAPLPPQQFPTLPSIVYDPVTHQHVLRFPSGIQPQQQGPQPPAPPQQTASYPQPQQQFQAPQIPQQMFRVQHPVQQQVQTQQQYPPMHLAMHAQYPGQHPYPGPFPPQQYPQVQGQQPQQPAQHAYPHPNSQTAPGDQNPQQIPIGADPNPPFHSQGPVPGPAPSTHPLQNGSHFPYNHFPNSAPPKMHESLSQHQQQQQQQQQQSQVFNAGQNIIANLGNPGQIPQYIPNNINLSQPQASQSQAQQTPQAVPYPHPMQLQQVQGQQTGLPPQGPQNPNFFQNQSLQQNPSVGQTTPAPISYPGNAMNPYHIGSSHPSQQQQRPQHPHQFYGVQSQPLPQPHALPPPHEQQPKEQEAPQTATLPQQNPLIVNSAFQQQQQHQQQQQQWNKVNQNHCVVQPSQTEEPQQAQPQQTQAAQAPPQVIQQIAQYTDAAGNTNTVIIVSPAVPGAGAATGNNLGAGVLNLIPGLQNVVQQPQAQLNSQCYHASPGQVQGRAGPCPCPNCKEKLSVPSSASSPLEKYKKVLPYPSTLTSPNSETQRSSPRPIQIRPAGSKPQKPIRIQQKPPTVILQNMTPIQPQPQLQQMVSPLKMLPLAMKPDVTPSTTTTPGGTVGVVLDRSNASNIPLPNSNIAVVRPMENPLQKLTDQISQIESSFMTPHPHQMPLQPHPQQQQHPLNGSPVPLHLPSGPHLTLVSASPPPSAIQSSSPSLAGCSSPSQPQLPQRPTPTPPMNGQPRLVLVDHGSPVRVSTSATPKTASPTTPTPTPTTPSRTTSTTNTTPVRKAGVKRKVPATAAAAPIKFTLSSKDGVKDCSGINQIKGGPYTSLKFTGRVKGGQEGTPTHVVVFPCIYLVPIPVSEGENTEGNRTVEEDAETPYTLPVPRTSGAANGTGSSDGKKTPRPMTHVAVVVYEFRGNDSQVIFRTADANTAWSFILDYVQGTRRNRNLPRICFPSTRICWTQFTRQEAVDMVNTKLGLMNKAVKFLVDQFPGNKSESAEIKPLASVPVSSSTEEDGEPVQENESGCARSEKFMGRKHFDMFGWLTSKHRAKPVPTSNPPIETSSILNPIPVHTTSRKQKHKLMELKEKADRTLIVCSSSIHGRGLFTRRKIEEGEWVIEYAGELIRPIVCDMREKYYEFKSVGCYMFRVDEDMIIDATMRGNAARFINHSCEPNCQARVEKISGKDHIIISALRQIQTGEELTYDYKFEKEEEKIPCSCGSKHCRKYLN